MTRVGCKSSVFWRWHECLSEFEFSVRCRAGRQHGNADGLSRQSVSIAVVEQESVLPAPFVQRRQWGSPEWRDAQQNDPELVRFREWLAADPRPDDFDLTGASPDLHMCWRGRQQFFLREEWFAGVGMIHALVDRLVNSLLYR